MAQAGSRVFRMVLPPVLPTWIRNIWGNGNGGDIVVLVGGVDSVAAMVVSVRSSSCGVSCREE